MNTSNKFDVNNYQFNRGSRNGVYIIHGFTNSTYEVKELALYLSKQGYYTRADNLPGHGTTPEDCNRCRYSDWIEFVEQGVAEMTSHCDNTFVIGISMGSVLALLILYAICRIGVSFVTAGGSPLLPLVELQFFNALLFAQLIGLGVTAGLIGALVAFGGADSLE